MNEKTWHNTVCLDFDGVIGTFPWDDKNPQVPVEGAMEGLYRLIHAGWYIEIYSGGSKYPDRLAEMQMLINTWSREYLIETEQGELGILDEYPDAINFPIGKPTAKVYVDDRGMGFIHWTYITPDRLNDFRAWWQHPDSPH